MSLYLKSTYSSDIFSNPSRVIMAPEDIESQDAVSNVAKAYLNDLLNANSDSYTSIISLDDPLGLEYAFNKFSYKIGKNCVSADPSLVLNNIDLQKQTIFDGNVTSSDSVLMNCTIDCYEGIFLDNYFYVLPNYGSYALGHEIPVNANNIIYFSYGKCKILSYLFTPSSQDYAPTRNTLILTSAEKQEYVEDFSSLFYYDSINGWYCSDAGLTKVVDGKFFDDFWPFLFFDNDKVVHGNVSSLLNIADDGTIISDSQILDKNSYVSICDFILEPPATNQIFCSASVPGTAIVNYNGLTFNTSDNQVCGTTPQTVISIFSFSDSSESTPIDLYKDFSSISSIVVDVYAYNFRYIKYNKNGTLYAFKDYGSVSSSTVKYTEALDLSKYFSLKEEKDGKKNEIITSLSFQFSTFKTSSSDIDASNYVFEVPVNALIPELISSEKEGDFVKIKTKYADRISYYFGDDASSAQTVSITTENSDGSEQETSISIVGKTGDFHFDIFNYFYDADSKIREIYSSKGNVFTINADIVIPSFAFSIKIGGTTASFYDSSDASTASINKTNCTPVDFDNYILLVDYSNSGDFSFILTFSLSSGYSVMKLGIGNSEPKNVTSGVGIEISKNDLLKLLKTDGSIEISYLLGGQYKFILPFKILNISSTPTSCSSVVISSVNFNQDKANVSFSFNYQYSDYVEYTILDSSTSSIVYGPISKTLNYSTSSASSSIVTDYFDYSSIENGLIVNVKTRNQSGLNSFSESTANSSTYLISKRLSATNPAEFLFFNDQAKTTPITEISKGITYYVFLQLYDINDSAISEANYLEYIREGSITIFSLIDKSDDGENDLDGVILNKISNYFYSFQIKVGSPFNDSDLNFEAQYESIVNN